MSMFRRILTAVLLVRVVSTVVLEVAEQGDRDTEAIVTLELVPATG